MNSLRLLEQFYGATALCHLFGTGPVIDWQELLRMTVVWQASLVAIAEHCSLLRELDVSKSAVTDSGLAALACAVQLNLQILSISGCSFMSDKSLPYLLKMGRTLLGLNIQHTNSISSSMVDLLVERLWRCDILS